MIPVLYQNAEVLKTHVGQSIGEITEEVWSIDDLKKPEKAPEDFLSIFGEFLNAGIIGSDTVRDRRVKVATAVRQHKRRGVASDTIERVERLTGPPVGMIPFTPPNNGQVDMEVPAGLTADEQDAVRLIIIDVAPAYMRVRVRWWDGIQYVTYFTVE